MNRKNIQKVREFVMTYAPLIQNTLPDVPTLSHRNAYAHLYETIVSVFGTETKNIDDTRIDDVMTVLNLCISHASELDIEKYFADIKPEPKPTSIEFLFD